MQQPETAISIAPFEEWYGNSIEDIHQAIANENWRLIKKMNNIYYSPNKRRSFSYKSSFMKKLVKRADDENLYIVVSELLPCGKRLTDALVQHTRMDHLGYITFLFPLKHMGTNRNKYGLYPRIISKARSFVDVLILTNKQTGIELQIRKII